MILAVILAFGVPPTAATLPTCEYFFLPAWLFLGIRWGSSTFSFESPKFLRLLTSVSLDIFAPSPLPQPDGWQKSLWTPPPPPPLFYVRVTSAKPAWNTKNTYLLFQVNYSSRLMVCFTLSAPIYYSRRLMVCLFHLHLFFHFYLMLPTSLGERAKILGAHPP